jgi:hypothetical protein
MRPKHGRLDFFSIALLMVKKVKDKGKTSTRRKFHLLSTRTGTIRKTVVSTSPLGAVSKLKKRGLVLLMSSMKQGKKVYVYTVEKGRGGAGSKPTITKRAEWMYR